MSEQQSINVITISQSYGSDGYRVAAKLAFRLQWLLTDYEITSQVIQHLDMPQEEAEIHPEHAYGFIDRFFFAMLATGESLSALSTLFTTPVSSQGLEKLCHETSNHAVKAISQSGQQIIIGHGAQVVLADRPDVLHIHVVTPFAQRIRNVMQREMLNEAQATAYIRRKDRQRARYFQSVHHRDVNDPLLYDLVLNSDGLELESLVDLISLALKRKDAWLALSV
jgi:CMP/dCMP kinase